ncbi:MAG: hypothetical protein FJ387_04570 [Verrucomicrobia bacterium]|nr:hypothetical protein [Verrucomicrobiota bacterium]
MSKLFWGLLTLVGTVALMAYMAHQAWTHFGPAKPQVSQRRREVADQLLPQIVEDLRKARGPLHSAVLLHLANDPTDYLTDRLRALILESGVLDLRDASLEEKIQRSLRLRVTPVGSIGLALTRARGRGVAGVIFGQVDVFESYPEGARLELELSLADVRSGDLLLDQRYVKQLEPGLLSVPGAVAGGEGFGPAQRFLGWALAVLLLPVFTIGFIRATVRRESNRANAWALAIYTVVDGVLAFLLLGGGLGSWFIALAFLGLVGLAFLYNVAVMSYALKLEI